MRTIILTLDSFAENARGIGGEHAVILRASEIGVDLADRLAGADLVMVFFHPSADGAAWTDDQGRAAVTAEQLSRCDLGQAVVLIGACFGIENVLMIEALKQAGARAIIAGGGVNVGGSGGLLAGGDWLAAGLRTGMEAGLHYGAALVCSKLALWLSGRRDARDALEYRIVHPARSAVGAALAGVAGVLAVLFSVLSLILGQPTPNNLTFFSSILPPPDVMVWNKEMYRDGTEVNWWGASVTVSDTDVISITDWIQATDGITFTLVEEWDTTAITMTGWITTGGGSVASGTGILTWTVTNVISSTDYGLTKTWGVESGAWSSSLLTETLGVEGGSSQTATITLEHGTPATPVPTKSPTPGTPTALPTFTPAYTPRPWGETPFPTPTACISGFGCQPTPGAELYYAFYLPLVGQRFPVLDTWVALYDAPDPVTVSGTLVYTIGAGNWSAEGGAAVVTDTLPVSVTFVSASSSLGACAESAGTVTCAIVFGAYPSVDSSAMIEIVVIAPSITGTITSTAAILAGYDPDTSDNSATVTTAVE